MKALTVRNVDVRLARALERETRRRGTSLNQTVLDLLREALRVGSPSPRTNGLERLAGTWTQEQFEEVEAAMRVFEQIDPEHWS